MKILMVCLGNICRSPLAEGIFREKVKAAGLQWEIDSAGTSGWHEGELPDRRSIEVARQFDLDITDQRSRPVRSLDFQEFDYIFAMDASNLKNLQEMARSTTSSARIHRMLEFAGYPHQQDVPDPYWDDDGFRAVYLMLDKASDLLLEKLFQDHPALADTLLINRG
jgi:protein-tyrosine phosphatase